MNELRVVFDTSVVISATILPRSVPRQSVDMAMKLGRLMFSEEILEELNNVLRRPKFAKYVSELHRTEFFNALLDSADIIPVQTQVKKCRDPNDDKFLALAVAGHATHLVSGDDDLLVLQNFETIPIVTPIAFITLCGEL